MPEYKIYLLNSFGHVTARQDLICEDFKEALAHASASALAGC
jgi:hypothetical protein